MSSPTMPDARARAGGREWAGLAVLALPTLLLAIDNSVLFLALPELSTDLRPTATQELWIMDSYGFLVAGFLLTMGGLGDRIGRRRLLLGGAAAFGAASVLAAYSTSAEMLIAARALLGIAGSTLMPSALALISTMFRDPRQRSLAVGVFVSCFMGGAALGPVVGGLLLDHFWWGSVFLLGVPVMVLLFVAGPVLLPAHRGSGSGRLDLPSVGLSLAAVLPVVYGLKELAGQGPWWRALLVAAAGAGFAAAFVRRQRRLADPLLDLRLFGRPAFRAALGILLCGMVLQGGLYLVMSQYLQLVEGLSPLRAGLWLVSPALALVVGSLLSPLLARRLRPATVIGAGLAVSAAGFAVLGLAGSDAGLPVLVTAMAVGFFGGAPIGALGIDLVVGSAPPEKAGSASSVAETSGELGVALGVATLGSVAGAVYRAQVVVPPATPGEAADAVSATLAGAVTAAERLPAGLASEVLETARSAFTTGLSVVAVVSAGIAAVLAVLAGTTLRRVRSGVRQEP
ncbi:MFS transporter [Prauserella muralis]|uniref:MFS transporter n=1 Tax=Prauserella muralis TaxID=588067 RepID=A0A2V4AHW7_9PSEU|nr:MFS transporter [Prauserella muralis]PXY19241.1 MFS transporter [Prauserella muralis]TWE29172.1 DHA2 family multidrug resistance protein-like MFS transporter [Prauserella muralis]